MNLLLDLLASASTAANTMAFVNTAAEIPTLRLSDSTRLTD